MIGLALEMAALTLAINLGLTFGSPILAIYFTFDWAQRQKWTNYPNLNGMMLLVAIIVVWVLLCLVVGQGEARDDYGLMVMFASRGNSWNPFWIGALKVGVGTIILGVTAIALAVVIAFIRWLATPRHR